MTAPLLLAAAFSVIATGGAAAQQTPSTAAERPIIEYDPAPTVHFDWNSVRIRQADRALLDRMAMSFRARGLTRIEVVGHADNSGSAVYNLALSRRRARAVAAYLASRGVPRRVITTRGLGDTRLMVETTEDGPDEQNRRAELYLNPFPVP